MSDPEGWEIAKQLIAGEAERQSGFLDLARLGLTAFPDELFEPEIAGQLNRLNLAAFFGDLGIWAGRGIPSSAARSCSERSPAAAGGPASGQSSKFAKCADHPYYSMDYLSLFALRPFLHFVLKSDRLLGEAPRL